MDLPSFNGYTTNRISNGEIRIKFHPCSFTPTTSTSIVASNTGTGNNLTLTKSSAIQDGKILYQIIVNNTGSGNINNVSLGDTNSLFNQSLCLPSLPTTLVPGQYSSCQYNVSLP